MIKLHLYSSTRNAKLNACHYIFSLILLTMITSSVRAANFCDPDVVLTGSDNTLLQTLTRLAEEYDFKLTFPASLDRPVRVKKSMKLNRLIKTLTKDLNTVLKHKIAEGCAVPVLTQIIILPVGTETAFVNTGQTVSNTSEDYITIENMELYVTDVLNGKQTAEPGRMTPEQQAEFNYMMETLQAQKQSD